MRTGLIVAAAQLAAGAAQPGTSALAAASSDGRWTRWVARLRSLANDLRARRRRDAAARDLRAALCALDDRMLRDLGFHRDEIASVAAEMHGHANPTRVRTMRDGLGPSI
jgi:hypothetical protein